MATTAQQKLERKRLAYARTFYGDGQTTLPEAQRVLDDLQKFCKYDAPGIVVSPTQRTVDPYAMAYRAGMVDVFKRITGFLGIKAKFLTEDNDHDRATAAITD